MNKKIFGIICLVIGLIIGLLINVTVISTRATDRVLPPLEKKTDYIGYDRKYVNGRWYVIFYNEDGISAVKE